MRKQALVFVMVALVAGIAGCRSKSSEQAPAQAVVAGDASGPASPWKVELRMTPEKPRMVKPTTFTVHIVDGKGTTVDNAQVRGTLSMKMMDMGKNELEFVPKGNGDYEATVKEMDMSGPWDLAVDASQGGFHAQKTFEIVVYD